MITIGQLTCCSASSLQALAGTLVCPLSRVGLHKRFTKQAVAFLLKCLRWLLQQKFSAKIVDLAPLDCFKRIFICDSSVWQVNPELSKFLPGSGGSASSASCKLQSILEVKSGQLHYCKITPGNIPDQAFTDHLPPQLKSRDLILFDLGYFKIQTFARITKKGAFFLTRFLFNTNALLEHLGKTIDLNQLLKDPHQSSFDCKATIGSELKMQLRLVAHRVDLQTSNQRRRRLIEDFRRRRAGKPSQDRLNFCDWTVLVTNIPENLLPAKSLFLLYANRWQVEIFFREMKSLLKINNCQSARPHRLHCEVLGRLILAVLICRALTLISRPPGELSLNKFIKRLLERAWTLLSFFQSQQLSKAITLILSLPSASQKKHQPSRKTLLQRLSEVNSNG
jgi:hypothetical protein